MTTQPSPSFRTPARLLRAAVSAGALAVCATQLAGCFPLFAGAVGTGVAVATDRRPTATQTVDRGLQMEIDSTLTSRYNGGDARVGVSVFNQKVLLTGEARDQNVKRQVDQYVRGLSNARSVVDELEVVSSPSFLTQTQDAYLTSKVKTLLMTADGVPSNSIKVTTEKSAVYLMGIVTREEGERAVDVARNAGGVTKVVKVFDYVSESERARLDAAASSQNPPVDGTPGTPAPVQSVPGNAQLGTTISGVPSDGGVAVSPVTSPTTSPVPLPPGRNLP